MQIKYRFLFALAACALLVLTVSANFTEQQRITSTPRGVGAQHGNAVAIDGDTMVVGARFDSTTASQAGAAFVYVLNGSTWTQQAVLLANDGAASDKFGYSVAISRDTIVVGSYNDDTAFSNGGSAYVFVRTGTTWAFQQKLAPGDGTADDEFGNAVGIQADLISVGSHFADLPGNSQAGSVYIYTRTGTLWSETQKLLPFAGVGGVILGDHFGESIAVSRGRIAIGAAGDDNPQTSAGAVYVYAEDGGAYGLQQKITIPSGTNGDNFGNSVAIEGDTLVGGAREDAPVVGQTARGSAYVFEFNGATWASQGQLLASDGASFDRFGYSVAVSNGTIAVGAREDDTAAGPDSGSAYIFKRSGNVWTQSQKLEPADPFNGDRFGGSVALSFLNLVVGAPEKALTAPNGQGAVYYFQEQPSCGSISFRTPRSFAVGINPRAVAVGDFNRDGKPDIVSANQDSNNLSVLLGNGQGGFATAVNFAVGDRPIDVKVADSNRDGKPDLAALSYMNGNVSVLLGDGSGNFGAPINSFVGFGGFTFTVADFNSDGIPDIANVTDSYDFSMDSYVFSVVLGNGAGGFGTPVFFETGDRFSPSAAGDFNRDGKIDLALPNYQNTASLFLGNGTGGFGPPANFGVGDTPFSITSGDVDLDGKLDLIVVNFVGNNVSVLLGNGEGSFAPAATFGPGRGGTKLLTADLDGDGKPDIVTTSIYRNAVSVLRGNGSGSFAPPLDFGTGKASYDVAAGDFNLDGFPDLVTAEFTFDAVGYNVAVLLNRCGSGSSVPKAPFDYDGDGKSDISVWRPNDGTWYLALSQSGVMHVRPWGVATDKIVPADYDGDKVTDTAVYRPDVGAWYVLNSATSTLGVTNFGTAGDVPLPQDFDGDGKADFAVFRPSNGVWYLGLSGSGTMRVHTFGVGTDKPVPADYDGDGKADIAVYRPSTGTWFVLDLVNSSFTSRTWGLEGDKPIPGDYTGDGKADYMVFRPSTGFWYRSNSEISSVDIIQWGVPGDLPVPGDYDGDGKLDTAIFRPTNGQWWVLTSSQNITVQTFGVPTDIPTESTFVY